MDMPHAHHSREWTKKARFVREDDVIVSTGWPFRVDRACVVDGQIVMHSGDPFLKLKVAPEERVRVVRREACHCPNGLAPAALTCPF